MKVTIACKSLLLKKSLELMLKDYISPYNECDLVISDKKINIKKRLFLINNSLESNLCVPFSKMTLLKELQNHIQKEVELKVVPSLEVKLQKLADNFVQDALTLIKNEN